MRLQLQAKNTWCSIFSSVPTFIDSPIKISY